CYLAHGITREIIDYPIRNLRPDAEAPCFPYLRQVASKPSCAYSGVPATIVAIMIIPPIIKSTNIVMTNFVLMKPHVRQLCQ
ncbi:MAG: hypothetical protein V3U60_14495, partial [Gammaproteobacteria bacterium]